MRKGWTTCAVACVGLAMVFALFGGMRYGYSMSSVAWLALSGAILGAIGAPEIEPKAFRYPVLWQIAFAVAGCTVLAAGLEVPLEGYLLAVLVGVILGYLAPYGIKQIQAP